MADKVGGVEFDVTVDSTGAVSGASKVIESNEKIETSFNKIDKTSQRSSNTIVKGNNSAAKAAQNLSRSIGMGGVQLGQFAGQIQGGQNALLAFSQQGTDIGMLFGPAGMIAGGVFAVGAAIAATLVPALTQATDNTSLLEKAMEGLRKATKRSEGGIYDFTDSVKELALVGKSVVTAELEATLIRAEDATKAASKGILEAFSKIDAGSGVFNVRKLDGLVESLVNANDRVKSVTGFSEIAKEIGKEFGKTGDEAKALGAEIIKTFVELGKKPSVEGLNALQKKLSSLVEGNEGASKAVKNIISDLQLFFSEAREAGGAADFARKQLDKLSKTGKIDLDIEEVNQRLTATQELTKALSQELLISKAELLGNKQEAQELASAFSLGLQDASQLPQPIKDLLAQLRLVGEQQEINSEAEKLAMRERADLAKQFAGVEKANAKDGGDSSELEKLTAKFEAERQIALEHQAMLLEMKVNANGLTEEEQQRHSDVMTGINKREADAKAALTKQVEDRIKSLRQNAVQNAIGLLDLFAGKSKAAAIAAIVLNKGLALAQNAQSTLVAQMKAFEIYGPTPQGAAAAASIGTYGAVNAGLIAATGLGQIASVGRGGASALTSSGGMPAQRTTGGGGGMGDRNISIAGLDPSSMFSGEQVRELLKNLAGDGGDFTFLTSGG